MSETSALSPDTIKTTPRIGEFNRFRRVFFSRGVVIFGMMVILIMIITAIFADFIAPYDPYTQDLEQILAQPNSHHLLGTDPLGRDTLSRIIYGSRTSLTIGLVSVTCAALVGMTLGLIAGYFGGWVFIIIMRFNDALMTIPMLLLALVIAATLGNGVVNIIIALAIGLTSVNVRLMCGQVLVVKENDYVLAARAGGASNFRIMFRHIAPNCLPPLIVLITMLLGTTILAEAGLSFLGIGIKPPTAAWGAMVSTGYKYLLSRPILSFAPGVCIMLVVFAFNMLGDGLRDALDPRLRGTF
jgi:peptide/nickel transport system permease protein